MGLFSTFLYIDIPVIYHVYPMDIHGISMVYQYTEQTHLYFSWYIPHLCIRSPYAFDIHGIYHVYTMYRHASLGYSRDIPCIFITYTTINLYVYT